MSNLRQQTTFSSLPSFTTASTYPSPPPAKKQRKMTITQTYRLVHTARGKLSFEASRAEHDLRLLVGHANLLDSLMVEIQNAEEEQEAWFNSNVTVASRDDGRQIIWKDELEFPDSSDDEEDSDDDMSEPESKVTFAPISRARSPPPSITVNEVAVEDDEDEEDSDDAMSEEEDEDAYNSELTLTRTTSHPPQLVSPALSPPELVHDSDDSDDDSPSDSRPSSPPQASLDYLSRQGKPQQEEAEAALFGDGFYIPGRNASTLVAAC